VTETSTNRAKLAMMTCTFPARFLHVQIAIEVRLVWRICDGVRTVNKKITLRKT